MFVLTLDLASMAVMVSTAQLELLTCLCNVPFPAVQGPYSSCDRKVCGVNMRIERMDC